MFTIDEHSVAYFFMLLLMFFSFSLLSPRFNSFYSLVKEKQNKKKQQHKLKWTMKEKQNSDVSP